MQIVTLACDAMATRFEIVLHGEDPIRLRAAGEEALEEIARLEAQLSFYRPSSEISRLNARAARGPVRVEPELFRLLQHAKRLSEETNGAFDITVAPLMRCWGFVNDTGRLPDPEELTEARKCVGMHLVQLNPDDFTVQFAREGVLLDLGAIGKGYALERATDILREVDVASALLHGGTSTIYGLGKPLDAECWKVAVDRPPIMPRDVPSPLAIVSLKDEALSVSAVWGKSFQADGKTYGHVFDPRTGHPVRGAMLAAVALPSAMETDALSTALLTLGTAGHERVANLRGGMRTLLLAESETGKPPCVETHRIKLNLPG